MFSDVVFPECQGFNSLGPKGPSVLSEYEKERKRHFLDEL